MRSRSEKRRDTNYTDHKISEAGRRVLNKLLFVCCAAKHTFPSCRHTVIGCSWISCTLSWKIIFNHWSWGGHQVIPSQPCVRTKTAQSTSNQIKIKVFIKMAGNGTRFLCVCVMHTVHLTQREVISHRCERTASLL